MKKTVLILAGILFLGGNAALGQEPPAKKHRRPKPATEDGDVIKWNNLRGYAGALTGFQVIKYDSAYATVTTPIGINYRHYSTSIRQLFWDLDGSVMPVVMNGTSFTTNLKISGGVGTTAGYYTVQLHASYAYNFLRSGGIIGFGHDIETHSVPISIDYLKFLDSREFFLLIGIKVPLASVSF